jgi:hypothetical protein
MPLIQDVLEKVSLQEMLDRLTKLENIQGVLQHNQDMLLDRQVIEDAEDTRAS